MKKLIYILGILFLTIVAILNIMFTATLDASEHITLNNNSIIYIIGLLLVSVLVLFITRAINYHIYKNTETKTKTNFRIVLFIISLVIYITFNIIWVLLVNPKVVGDSIHVCNMAQTFYRGSLEKFLSNTTYVGIPLSEYMRKISSSNYLSVYIQFVF